LITEFINASSFFVLKVTSPKFITSTEILLFFNFEAKDINSPSRFEAQNDAANLICGAKTQQNPETTVALLTMAGKSPSVQVSLTTNLGKLLSCLTTIGIGGKTNFGNSIRVAQLALKRRNTEQNQGGARRIIIFIASPIEASEEELISLASKLKKK